MSEREISFYIVDIFIAIGKIENYIKSFSTAQELLYSELYWDATIRELEIVGEATNKLLSSNILRKEYRRVVDFRNQIAHGYFGINENIVWDIIKNKIPSYKQELLQVVRDNNIEITKAIDYAKKEFKNQKNSIKVLNNLEKLI